jgi:predicted enzyme related to lactoylglutathione lyase
VACEISLVCGDTDVNMPIAMTRVILYVRSVELLKSFYQMHFGFPVVDEIAGEWVVLQAGAVEIALHLVGKKYREDWAPGSDATSNAKMVFTVQCGLPDLREKLVTAGVQMKNLKRYPGFPQLLCDGQDPEGNVFQLSQPD